MTYKDRDRDQATRDARRKNCKEDPFPCAPGYSPDAGQTHRRNLLGKFIPAGLPNGSRFTTDFLADPENLEHPALIGHQELLAGIGVTLSLNPPAITGSKDVTITALPDKSKKGPKGEELFRLTLDLESFLTLCSINDVNPRSKLSPEGLKRWKEIQSQHTASRPSR